MVRDSTSYTAGQAREQHLIEWEVSGEAELLTRLDGHALDFADRKLTFETRDLPVVNVPMSLVEAALNRLAEPTLASLLLSIGTLGILYELGAPGIGLGGIVGVTSVLLGLMGLSVLPIQLVGVLLMVAGVFALLIEIKVPTHGLVGFAGVISMTVGGIVLFDASEYFGAFPRVDWHIQVPVMLLLGALLLLLAAQASRALEARPITGSATMIGNEGVVSRAFTSSPDGFIGTVCVQGTYWTARSSAALELGAAIEVIEVSTRPMQLHVQRSRKGRS
jgi:membrane-bound serine protease (ClpP class)